MLMQTPTQRMPLVAPGAGQNHHAGHKSLRTKRGRRELEKQGF